MSVNITQTFDVANNLTSNFYSNPNQGGRAAAPLAKYVLKTSYSIQTPVFHI